MPTFTLHHFSKAETLRAVQAEYLLELLGRYGEYFRSRDVDLGSSNAPDYDAIAHVLMVPDEQTPAALVNDLYYVDELATPEAMDELLDAATSAGVELALTDEPTPADVAVQLRLRAPQLLERKHAEHFVLQGRRTFEYFQSHNAVSTAFRQPGPSVLQALEKDLGARLDALKRGRTCKVFVFTRKDGVWFLVRRGDPFKREGSLERSETTSVYYRPEKYDVLKYDETLGELSVNTGGTKPLIAVYRKLFGAHLFGDADRFPGTGKFTLAPLQADGEAALVCSDVDGIDWVKLKEVQTYWGGAEGEIEIRRAKDLFAALKARSRQLPAKARLIKASFLVKFSDAKVPRTVTIRPANIASYTRDSDAGLVEEWLTRRGFIKTTEA